MRLEHYSYEFDEQIFESDNEYYIESYIDDYYEDLIDESTYGVLTFTLDNGDVIEIELDEFLKEQILNIIKK